MTYSTMENYFYAINVCFLVYKCSILKKKKEKAWHDYLLRYVPLSPLAPLSQTDDIVQYRTLRIKKKKKVHGAEYILFGRVKRLQQEQISLKAEERYMFSDSWARCVLRAS